jgi:hypothetical protein
MQRLKSSSNEIIAEEAIKLRKQTETKKKRCSEEACIYN